MVDIAQHFLDEIPEIRAMVTGAYAAAKDNIERFDKMRKFVYITTLSQSVLDACAQFKWPAIEINTIEANISRLAGEFAKQMISPSVRARSDSTSADMVDFVESRLRYVFESPEMDNIKKSTYSECLSGGFSSAEVIIDYADPYTFEQDICFAKCFDPTLVFFDPMARKNHKGDGDFVFYFTPMTKESFKNKYPAYDLTGITFSAIAPGLGGIQVPWFIKEPSLSSGTEDQAVVYVCDFYRKKMIDKKLVGFKMPDGRMYSMLEEDYEEWAEEYERDNKIARPKIEKERDTQVTEVWHYCFVKDQYIKRPKKTPFRHLPIVGFDGNGQIIEGRIATRPYPYQAVGSQKLLNMAAIAMANGIESMNNTQFLMCEESMPTAEQDKIAIRSPQKQQAALIWKAWPQTNAAAPNPAPIIIPRSSFDPVLLQAISSATQLQQQCLGNFNTTLGLNQGEINKIAVEESIVQSNAAAMPFIENFMDSVNQLAAIYVDVLPLYFKTPRSVPIIDRDGMHKSILINDENDPNSPQVMNYESLDLAVSVKAGANFNLQKDRAVEVIEGLMKATPAMAKFFGEGPGTSDLLNNIDMRGIENVRRKYAEFAIEEEKNKGKQQELMMKLNPEVIKKQIADQDFQIKQMQILVDRQQLQMEMQVEKMKLQQTQLETIAKIRDTEAKTQIATISAGAEIQRAQVDQAIALDEHLSNKIENDREHLSNMLDISVKHMHNTNQHKQAVVGLAIDAKAAADAAGQAKAAQEQPTPTP